MQPQIEQTRQQLIEELAAAKQLIQQQACHIELLRHNYAEQLAVIERQCEPYDKISQQETGFKNCVENMLGRLGLFSTVRDKNGIIIDFKCEFVNKASCQAQGRTKEELVGRNMLDFWPGMKGKNFMEFVRVCETGAAYSNDDADYYNPQLDVMLKYEIEAFKWGDGLGVSVRDVTEQKHHEAELSKRQQKFAKLFYNNIAAMAVINLSNGAYIDVNPAWENLTGYSREETLGLTSFDLHLVGSRDSSYHESLRNLLALGSVVVEHDLMNKNGETRTAICSFVVLESSAEKVVLGTFIDVTKQRQLEKELARLDRLNIVGEMAAGIGHEIRNPMTTVRGYLQLLQLKSQFSEFSSQLATMIEELDRANCIISEFLSLAKNKCVETKLVNINDTIQTLLPLFQAEAFQLGHEFVVQTGEVTDIRINEEELRQLLHNLVRNGLEAMSGSGRVTVSTYSDAGQTGFSVQDTGTGIAPQVMARLGIPFVTTKKNGTGIGLSTCYRIAERHHARIDVKTSGSGTTFFVIFPAAEAGQALL